MPVWFSHYCTINLLQAHLSKRFKIFHVPHQNGWTTPIDPICVCYFWLYPIINQYDSLYFAHNILSLSSFHPMMLSHYFPIKPREIPRSGLSCAKVVSLITECIPLDIAAFSDPWTSHEIPWKFLATETSKFRARQAPGNHQWFRSLHRLAPKDRRLWVAVSSMARQSRKWKFQWRFAEIIELNQGFSSTFFIAGWCI